MSDKYMNWFWYAFTYLAIVLGIFTTILLIDSIFDLPLIEYAEVTGNLSDIVVAFANIGLLAMALFGYSKWKSQRAFEIAANLKVQKTNFEGHVHRALFEGINYPKLNELEIESNK